MNNKKILRNYSTGLMHFNERARLTQNKVDRLNYVPIKRPKLIWDRTLSFKENKVRNKVLQQKERAKNREKLIALDDSYLKEEEVKVPKETFSKTTRSKGKRVSISLDKKEKIEKTNFVVPKEFAKTMGQGFSVGGKPYQLEYGEDFIKAIKMNRMLSVYLTLEDNPELINEFDYMGQTAVHWAAKLGNLEMLKILIPYCKNVNYMDYKHRTPLYLAMNFEKEKCVFFLLENGGNIEIPDINGFTPFDACKNKELKNKILLYFDK